MNKNLLFFALVLCSLASCQVLRPPVRVFSDALDYTIYQQKGFFMTEASAVSFEYKPVASVTSLVTSGYRPVESAKKKTNKVKVIRNVDDVYGNQKDNGFGWGKTEFVPASRAVTLAELHKKALESGADGIINLKIEPFRIQTDKGVYDAGYQATGMAIKRN